MHNPAFVIPQEIKDAQRLIIVPYVGADGQIHDGEIVVHTELEQDVRDFFAYAVELRFPIEKVIPIHDPRYAWDDITSCADNNTSCYNYRPVTGTKTTLSNHALGRAFDLNPVQNPYIAYDTEGKETYRIPAHGVYDPAAPGTLRTDHPLVRFLKERGWEWGGDWLPESGRTDYQHLQKPA